MRDLRTELAAMSTAYEALRTLPADRRATTLAAVQHKLDQRDIAAAIDQAEAAGLIEDVT